MRIAIDALELSGRATGVGRYLSQLLSAWGQLPEAADHDFLVCGSEPIAIAPSWPRRTSVLTSPGLGTRWRQLSLPRLVRSARADLLFAPAYEAPLLTRLPTVLSVHDVSFAAHPEWFAPRERMRRRLLTRAAAHRAARVLTFSEFSKREIVRYLKVEPERIEVIYHGITRFPNDPNDPNDRASALVLYVGSIFNRRHVPELIDGFCRLAARRASARLAIVGDNRTQPHQDLGESIARCPAGRAELRSYLSDEELAGLYRRARAMAFLSDYEGFGMTPLDALAVGIPILVLDTPVAREIYGPAALYLDRPDPALIEGALERLLFDESERRRILTAAATVLPRYSWQASGLRTLQAMMSAVR